MVKVQLRHSSDGAGQITKYRNRLHIAVIFEQLMGQKIVFIWTPKFQ